MPNLFAPVDDTIPPDAPGIEVESRIAAQLAARLHDLATPISHALGELNELMRRPTPVWVRPADRTNWFTMNVETGHATQILGAQLDRARITLINAQPAATGNPISIGANPGIRAGGLDTFSIPAGATLTLDSRDALYAIAGGGAGTLSVINEEYDLTAGGAR